MTGSEFVDPPASAAWRHHEARNGYEVCFFAGDAEGFAVRGTTAAVEDGHAWAIEYAIRLDPGWRTERGHRARAPEGGRLETRLELDPGGRWRIDGVERPDLDGVLDVDLGSSSMTNAFPVRRLGLAVGESSPAPAAWVRELDLSVARLEQHYERCPTTASTSASPTTRPSTASTRCSPTTVAGWCSTTRASPSATPRASGLSLRRPAAPATAGCRAGRGRGRPGGPGD